MADLFLSYARRDREVVEALARALARAGFSVWWDRNLQPARQWDAEIERELEEAGAVVVLWSKESVQSEFVRAEADYAKARQKLLPVLTGPCEIPVAFRLQQSVDLPGHAILSEDIAVHPAFSALVRAARPVMAEGRSAASDVRAAAEKRQSRLRLMWVAAAIATVAAAGIFLSWKSGEAANVRQAVVTANGVGLSLGRLRAVRDDAAAYEPPPPEPTAQEAPCLAPTDASTPCGIAWTRQMRVFDLGNSARMSDGSLTSPDVSVVGTTNNIVYVAGRQVEFDFASHCAADGSSCGITAISEPRTMRDSTGINNVATLTIGLADGAVITLHSNGHPELAFGGESGSPIVSIVSNGGSETILRRDGLLRVGVEFTERVQYAANFAMNVTRMQYASTRLDLPANAECGPTGAIATADGGSAAAAMCGAIYFFHKDAQGQWSAAGAVEAAGAGSPRAVHEDTLVLFAPGLAIADLTRDAVWNFERGKAATAGLVRGRLTAVVISDDGSVVLYDFERSAELATVRLLEGSIDRASVSFTSWGVQLMVETSEGRQGWKLDDPSGPLR